MIFHLSGSTSASANSCDCFGFMHIKGGTGGQSGLYDNNGGQMNVDTAALVGGKKLLLLLG